MSKFPYAKAGARFSDISCLPQRHAIKFPGLLNIVHRKTAECLAYVEHGRTPRILVF